MVYVRVHGGVSHLWIGVQRGVAEHPEQGLVVVVVEVGHVLGLFLMVVILLAADLSTTVLEPDLQDREILINIC